MAKYCGSCGTQMDEKTSFCPNCGAPVENNSKPSNTEATTSNSSQPSGTRPKVVNRNIVVCILLSIVTCGIYGIVWFVQMVNDVNTVCQDEKSSQSGGTVFLLTLITCGIYGIIFFYNAGKRLANAGTKYNIQISDNSTLYLILSLLGLQIVDYCLVQSDLNRFSE